MSRKRCGDLRSVRDADLDYLRDPRSFRPESFRVVKKVYDDGRRRGLTPTTVAAKVLDPIWIDVDADCRQTLVEGRHRLKTAVREGATAIHLVHEYLAGLDREQVSAAGPTGR